MFGLTNLRQGKQALRDTLDILSLVKTVLKSKGESPNYLFTSAGERHRLDAYLKMNI